jgi:hypothetical protein
LGAIKITQLSQLYEELEKNNISVNNVKLPIKKAVIFKEGELVGVAVNYSKITTNREERIIMAEELAHFNIGSFYNLDASLYEINKNEELTKQEQIRYLMPPNELREFIRDEETTIYEISEHFNITEDLVFYAFNYYRRKDEI